MKAAGWLRRLEVTAGGAGIVSHAGLALLRALADNTGLTGGLSRALATDRPLVHDRGRVLADLACAIADGAEVISDFRVMGDQEVRPGHQLVYSVGWELGERERTAIAQVPGGAWQIAIDRRGEVRERRAEGACGDLRCGHRHCWVEEAHVTELTGLLRHGPAGDQIDGWPAAMRVFARRERPHPGAQLTLFEAEDGWRYSLWVTNLPATVRGWRANPAYIDAAHRVHARAGDCVRTGKTQGSGSSPPPRSPSIRPGWPHP